MAVVAYVETVVERRWDEGRRHRHAPQVADGRHRVVIIGSGFGGLFAARALRRAPVEVTLIDRTNHHLFQPLLYQVATGILSEGEIAPATRDVLRATPTPGCCWATVTAIDLDGADGVATQWAARPRSPTTASSWPPGWPPPTSATTSSPASPPG